MIDTKWVPIFITPPCPTKLINLFLLLLVFMQHLCHFLDPNSQLEPILAATPQLSLVYIGIGSYLINNRIESADQQLPPFFDQYARNIPSSDDSGDNQPQESAQIYLFDPNYKELEPPLAIKLTNSNSTSQWDHVYRSKPLNIYRRYRLTVVVSNQVIYRENGSTNYLYNFIKGMYNRRSNSCFSVLISIILLIQSELLLSPRGRCKVVVGVFAVPYLMVEETKDIVEMYNQLLEDADLKKGSPSLGGSLPIANLHYFHLADYAEVPSRI